MNKFVCFGYIEESRWALKSEEEQANILQNYFSYYQKLVEQGNFINGEGLKTIEQGVRLNLDDGQVNVTKMKKTGEQIGGYFLIKARDMEHAISLLSKHPGLQVGPFEIRPVDEELTETVGAGEHNGKK